jgi:hypothetical protein
VPLIYSNGEFFCCFFWVSFSDVEAGMASWFVNMMFAMIKVLVMGEWSAANESSWLTCQFFIIYLFDAIILVNMRSMIDCCPNFDCQAGNFGVLTSESPLLSSYVL